MKVLLASESFAPNISGVATATKNLAVNLIKNGHEPFVLTPGKTLRNKIDKAFPDYPVYRLKSIPNFFRLGYRIAFISDLEMERLVRKIEPDIIHLQDPATIGQSLRRVGKKLGIPVIITNHFSLEYALSYVKALNIIRPLLEKILISYLVSFYNKCDHVVTPTLTFKTRLENWGVKTPISAISNGIEIDKFTKEFSEKQQNAFRQKFHLPEKPLVLYLGRIDKDKSIDVLVRAIPEILKRIDVHFVVAGTGDEISNIKNLARKLKVENKITFIGYLDHNSDEFVMMYKVASLFAIPSTIETQSLVTLEAMSSNLPIVAADAGALPELVHNDKNGFLFQPGKHSELAEKIVYVLDNQDHQKRMGNESHKIAETHEMSKAFAKMLDLYKKMTEK